MKRMHEQLHLLGVRASSLSWRAPKVFVVARASLRSALIPLSPPFLMLVSVTRTSPRATRFHAEAQREGRGAENRDDNNKLNWVVDGGDRCAGCICSSERSPPRHRCTPAPPRGITLRKEACGLARPASRTEGLRGSKRIEEMHGQRQRLLGCAARFVHPLHPP